MRYILNKYFQLPPSALISKDDLILSPSALNEWKDLTARRAMGEPIAYLVGKKQFHKIELQVKPGVLIPRPETELLVEIALNEIRLVGEKVATPTVLDLGTGSGAIALAIASEAPHAEIVATDKSTEALAIAKFNSEFLGLNRRVKFIRGNWYQALRENRIFDMIISNPPYIEAHDPHLFQGDLRFEPTDALTDHANGLSYLKTIVLGAKNYLKPKGLLAIEHGFNQSIAVIEFMKSAGLKDIQTHQDLAGCPRVASGRK